MGMFLERIVHIENSYRVYALILLFSTVGA